MIMYTEPPMLDKNKTLRAIIQLFNKSQNASIYTPNQFNDYVHQSM